MHLLGILQEEIPPHRARYAVMRSPLQRIIILLHPVSLSITTFTPAVLKRGIKLRETNRRHCAVCKQCPLPLKRIIPNIEEKNPDYECAAAAYARSGNLTELNKLLDVDKRLVNDTFDETKVKEKKVVTLLYIAAQEGHTNIVDRLIDLGADKNKGNKNGATPLYIAAENGRTDTVRCLVSEGADKDKGPHLRRGNPSVDRCIYGAYRDRSAPGQ